MRAAARGCEIERTGRTDALVDERLDRHRVLVRLAHRRRHRAIARECRADLGVELAERLDRARVRRPRRGQAAERHFDIASPDLTLLAGADEIGVAQVA